MREASCPISPQSTLAEYYKSHFLKGFHWSCWSFYLRMFCENFQVPCFQRPKLGFAVVIPWTGVYREGNTWNIYKVPRTQRQSRVRTLILSRVSTGNWKQSLPQTSWSPVWLGESRVIITHLELGGRCDMETATGQALGCLFKNHLICSSQQPQKKIMMIFIL